MPKNIHNADESLLPSIDDVDRRKDPLLVKSVQKALAVLEIFAKKSGGMSLTALAAELGVDKSTAQRFSYTLAKLGYLYKDEATKHYGLSVKVLDLGYGFLHANMLLKRAMPYLIHLSRETEETVNITVLDGDEVVFISRFMNRHLFNTDVTIGTRMPAYCTAPGIAILSTMDRQKALKILSETKRRSITKHTTWEMDALKAKLELSEARGYATAFEEFYPDDLSISAPIIENTGAVAAVTISVSRSRYSTEQAETTYAPLVIAAARSISHSS